MRDARLLASSEQDSSALPEGVRQVLDSRTFEKAPALRALLTYLWRNRAAQISEYAVATEALGRSASFDARTDATVRVQVSRLRQRLEKFYEQENSVSPYRLTIPLGTHEIVLHEIQQLQRAQALVLAEEIEVPAVTPRPEPWGSSRFFAICSAVLLLGCISEGVLLYRASTGKGKVSPERLAWFWQSFFSNGRQARMALPTPVFFSFTKPKSLPSASVMFRDTEVNDFSKGGVSEPLRLLEQSLGRPTLAESYTVTSDTFAAVQLVRYLDRFERRATVTSSADAPLEALDTENLIAVGTWGTLAPLKPYLDSLSFELGPHEEWVDIRNPAPGEPKRLLTVEESPERRIRPGVIAFLPGNGGHTRLLVLASRNTSALVSLLTSSNGLDQLEKMWKSQGSPPFFDVAVNAEESGRGLVRAWPIFLHPYKNKP